MQAAGHARQHVFDLLGSGPFHFQETINWQQDFKSGYGWNASSFFLDIPPAPYPGGYDIKIPWELSRCQHLVWLGQAYWICKDEQYARDFKDQIEGWLRSNPPMRGVNWACTMDVAIRAVNWLWAYAFFRESPILDDEFHLAFHRSLLVHGRHIRANLEWSDRFTGNHYLADIVGLVYLGILLPELREAAQWRKLGLAKLEQEMFRQVTPDGVDFEASTGYHRLVCEMFLSATLLAQRNGHRFSQEYMRRLEKMLEFVQAVTMPDGATPFIGDNDNGRLHRLKIWQPPEREWSDFRYLLAIGAVLFTRADFAAASIGQEEEAVWFFGEQALRLSELAAQPAKAPESHAFPDGGIYVMRDGQDCAIIDAGPVGQNGSGGHAHNDTFSFVLQAGGVSWVVDPGTYVYTQDYDARHRFRSTAYHNVFQPEGLEQNVMDARQPFRTLQSGESSVLKWAIEQDGILFHGLYRFPGKSALIWERLIFFDRGARIWLVRDALSQPAAQGIFRLHLAPEVLASPAPDQLEGFLLSTQGGGHFRVFIPVAKPAELRIETGWVSPGYGTRREAPVLTWSPVPKAKYLVGLGESPEDEDFLERFNAAQAHLARLLST